MQEPTVAQNVRHKGPGDRVVVVAGVAAEGAGFPGGQDAPLLEAAQVDVARGALAQARGDQLAGCGGLIVFGLEADAAAALVNIEIGLAFARGGVEVQVDVVAAGLGRWGGGRDWRGRVAHVGRSVGGQQGLLIVVLARVVMVVVADVVLACASGVAVVVVAVSSFM